MKYTECLIILFLICLTATGCINKDSENNQITKNAIEYFSSKYDINKNEIKIDSNNFYGPNEKCWNTCGENVAKIIYSNKSYKISYDNSRKTFGDNYQYEEIKNDFDEYILEIFPYASKIIIDLDELDVLATPTKYNGDIENYVKNTIIRHTAGNGLLSNIKIWIKSNDSNEAKELHNKYRKDLIIKLENLNISYSIAFSNNEGSNEYSSFYYYSVSSGGREPAFMYWDRVDKTGENYPTTKLCYEKSIVFIDDEIFCK